MTRRDTVQSAIQELKILVEKVSTSITDTPSDQADSFDYYMAAKNVLNRRLNNLNLSEVPDSYVTPPARKDALLGLLRQDVEVALHKERERLEAIPLFGRFFGKTDTEPKVFQFALRGLNKDTLTTPYTMLTAASKFLITVDCEPATTKKEEDLRYLRDYIAGLTKALKEFVHRAKQLKAVDKGLLVSIEGYFSILKRF